MLYLSDLICSEVATTTVTVVGAPGERGCSHMLAGHRMLMKDMDSHLQLGDLATKYLEQVEKMNATDAGGNPSLRRLGQLRVSTVKFRLSADRMAPVIDKKAAIEQF